MPLALAFLYDHIGIRVIAIFCALITDGLDGYLARKYHSKSILGTLLDPLMDKFFVFFALLVLMSEAYIPLWQVGAFFGRDLSIMVFGIYLFFTGQLYTYIPKAIWCGKVTTVLQMIVLIGLSLRISIPDSLYFTFIALGMLALGELALSKKSVVRS
jgi:CDP-diacylglycerol--glycerol-3-phosphate 3-phosphatidyltransferase